MDPDVALQQNRKHPTRRVNYFAGKNDAMIIADLTIK
jgi:hypothetical protein